MNFIDYFKVTIPTTKYCLKITGIIFTSIGVILWGITETTYGSESILDAIKIFIICFIFGNALGVFIALLAVIDGFRNQKKIILLYKTIPNDLKEKYTLDLSIHITRKYQI